MDPIPFSGIRVADRLAGSGLNLGAIQRPGPSAGTPAVAPAPPTSLPQSPFDSRDLVDIRGNLRPMAAEASVALGATDEEGGGAQNAPSWGGKRNTPVFRPLLEAYGALPPSRGLPPSFPPPAPLPAEGPERRSRRLSEAFRTPRPEEALGRRVDLAA